MLTRQQESVMKNEGKSHWGERIVDRIVITLIAGVVIAGAALEIAVAFGIQWAVSQTSLALWAGAILWAVICAAGWIMRVKWGSDDSPFWALIPFSALAALSVAAVFMPGVRGFCVWSNAALWTVMILSVCGMFRDEWGKCVPVKDTDQPLGGKRDAQHSPAVPRPHGPDVLGSSLGLARLVFCPGRFFY